MHVTYTFIAFCVLAVAAATPLLPSSPSKVSSSLPSIDEQQLPPLHRDGQPGQCPSILRPESIDTPHIIEVRETLEVRGGPQLQGKLGGMYMCTGPN